MKTTTRPPFNDQGPAFLAHSLQIILFGPFIYEPNVIFRVVKFRVPTIGALYGKACALAWVAVGSNLCQAKVSEGSSISSNMLLLFRQRFPLGAMPRSANGMGSPMGFQHQANSPYLIQGANKRKKTSFGQNQGLV